MLLSGAKACCLIFGLTVAGFFFGYLLGYNNVWIWEPSFQCTRGSKECADGWFCNRDFKGIHGYCESSYESYLFRFFLFLLKKIFPYYKFSLIKIFRHLTKFMIFYIQWGGLFCNFRNRKFSNFLHLILFQRSKIVQFKQPLTK